MPDFLRMADQIGNDLVSAGIGLKAIGNMLGADGVERDLSTNDENGLHHVVIALGCLIAAAGYDLCAAIEDEDLRKQLDSAKAEGGEQ